MSPSERREMIRKENTDLSLTRQCKLLKISRSSIYYTPVGVNAETLKLMHEIDRVFTKYPFFGSRQIAAYLPQSGFSAGRHRVRRLMNIMGLQTIYKGPNTSKKHPQHRIYPYLLRKLPITRPNQVWCSDITYIPVRNGFLYLVAIRWLTGVFTPREAWIGQPARCCPGGSQIRWMLASVLRRWRRLSQNMESQK